MPAIFDLLETFIAVVEQGSLSEAAKQLHANQPNLSVKIQKLEQDLGVKLFDREGKKLILNPIGQRMYEQTKSLLNMYYDIRGEIQLFTQPNFGHIRIGGGFQILLTILPQFLLKFRESHPNVTYTINEIGPSNEIFQLVDQYEIDLGLVDTKHAFENIEVTPLKIDTKISLIVPKNSPLSERKNIEIEDLNKLNFITFKKGTKIMNYIENKLKENGISLTVSMEIDHIELIIKLVEMGMGAAFLPISTGSRIFADKNISILNVNGLEFPSRPIYLIYRKNRFYPPALLEFMEEMNSFF
ncbi:LysR family transcriptional regulator [Falsibacillus pallidus]|uniref:LysR family transcriptional regulator n=1 Tax=Falsibacillus pallidus TaxID=493781 RepID=UPI003D992FD3